MVTIQLTLSSECIGRKSKVLMDFMRLLILLPPRPTMNKKLNGGGYYSIIETYDHRPQWRHQ